MSSRPLLSLVAAALLLTACGGDDPAPTPTETAVSPGADAATDQAMSQLSAQREAIEAEMATVPEVCHPFYELNLAVTDLLALGVAGDASEAQHEQVWDELDAALAGIANSAPASEELIGEVRAQLEEDRAALRAAGYDLEAMSEDGLSAFDRLDEFDPVWVPAECQPEQPAPAETGTDGSGSGSTEDGS